MASKPCASVAEPEIAPIRILCANYMGEGSTPTQCQNPAIKICGSCLLVKQGRQPDFVTLGEVKPPAYMRYLWGQVPAYDILNLDDHEGKAYDQDLALCFASSGDPRNLIQSVIGLPKDYRGTLTCIVNEEDPLHVVRNVMILMASMLLPPRKAAEFMLHLWYSARLTSEMSDVISHIRTLISAAIETFDSTGENNLCRSTWKFGTQQLSLCLNKDAWSLVVRILSSPHLGLDIELGFRKPDRGAEDRRRAVMLTPHLLDQREAHLFDLPPSQRLSAQRTRETGILSPFGSDIAAFTHANPTFYDLDSGQWLQHPSSDPLRGHPIEAVLRCGVEHGVPKNDIYGSLYTYILSRLTAFSSMSANTAMNVHFYSLPPMELPSTLSHSLDSLSCSAFDRIDASDLADGSSRDLELTLSRFGPMLKPPSQSLHARLITLFPKAASEAHTHDGALPEKDALNVAPFLPVPDFDPCGPLSAPYVQFLAATQIVRDYDAAFERYMAEVGFGEVGDAAGMEMVQTNTIVEAWPTRLRKRAGEDGAQRAFDLALRSEATGCERYVEWVRKE